MLIHAIAICVCIIYIIRCYTVVVVYFICVYVVLYHMLLLFLPLCIVGQPVLFINEREEGSPGTHQTYIADRFTSLNYMCIVDIVYDTTTAAHVADERAADVSGAGVGAADVAVDGVYTPLDLTPYKIPTLSSKHATDTTTTGASTTTPTMTKEQIQAVADIERNLRLKPTHKLKYSIFKNKGHISDLSSTSEDHQEDGTGSMESNVYLGNWRRSCSLATYGAMAPYTVIKPLTHAPKGNKNICTDITTGSDNGSESNTDTDNANANDSLNIQQTSDESELLNDNRDTTDLTRTLTDQFTSMLNWARDAFSGTTHNSDHLQDDDISRQEGTTSTRGYHWGSHIDVNDIEGQNYDSYEDSILLCERGGCVFEDKSMHAQRAGAAGLIVGNNEVGLCMNIYSMCNNNMHRNNNIAICYVSVFASYVHI